MRPLYLALSLILLLSCAKRSFVPIPDGYRIDAKNSAVIYTDRYVTIQVRTNSWDGYPSSLEERLLPLYIEILNRTDEPIKINRIVLLDDTGTQYNPLSPESASRVASGYSVGLSLGLGYGVHHGLGWFGGMPARDYGEDIVNRAFIPGEILPGAKLKGFLYFQKLPDKVNRITLRVMYSIGFQSESVNFYFKVKDEEGDNNGNKEGR